MAKHKLLVSKPSYLNAASQGPQLSNQPSLTKAIDGVNVVYYVRLDTGAIKIGTTQNLVRRLVKFNLSLAKTPHRILAIEFGSFELEKQRHLQFSHLRISHPITTSTGILLGRTEQFYEAPDLMAHIEELKSNLRLRQSV